MGAKLFITDNAVHPIIGTCSLGRQVGNTVMIQDEQASRRHALIHVQNGNEYWLVDLGSRNGTFVNGKRIQGPTLLRDQDGIAIGDINMKFLQGEENGTAMGDLDAGMTITTVKSTDCWLLLLDIKGFTQFSQQLSPDDLAKTVGAWMADCKAAIEESGGVINKYLGDGIFAYWRDTEGSLPNVVNAVNLLKFRQSQGSPEFRIVVHHGLVTFGGASVSGEESLLGPEVNFVFRSEKIAAGLQAKCTLSQTVAKQWPGKSSLAPLGQHPVQGFKGMFGFYSY